MAGSTGLFKALLSLIPPEIPECQDEKSRARHYQWRRAVFVFALLLSSTIGYCLATYATDVGVDRKLKAATVPIAKQVEATAAKVDALNAQVAATNKLLIAKLASDLRESIWQTQVLKCKSKSNRGFNYFRGRLEEFRQQYLDLTGEESQVQPCSEL